MTQPGIEQTFLVTPGGAVRLGYAAQLINGATILNNDRTNGVWISSNPGVGIGQGSFLGPGISLVWNNTTNPPYAVLDTGVTTPVSINVSTNVSGLNPSAGAIGAATAAAIQAFNQQNVVTGVFPAGRVGVFNVSAATSITVLTDLRGRGRFTGLLPVSSTIPVVSDYSSVLLEWLDTSSTFVIASQTISIVNGLQQVNIMNAQSDNLRITAVNGPITIAVITSNKSVTTTVLPAYATNQVRPPTLIVPADSVSYAIIVPVWGITGMAVTYGAANGSIIGGTVNQGFYYLSPAGAVTLLTGVWNGITLTYSAAPPAAALGPVVYAVSVVRNSTGLPVTLTATQTV